MIKVLEGAKWIAFACLMALGISLLTGGKPSDTSFDAMAAAIREEVDLDLMVEGDNLAVKKLYGIEPSAYKGTMLYYPPTNMDVLEVLLVQLEDSAQEAEVLAAIDARVETQRKSFDGYGIEQMGLLEKRLVISEGNYVLFVVWDNTDPIKQAFQNAL